MVWFSGSTALKEGMGLCYDLDYLTTDAGETATDPFEARGAVVTLPSGSGRVNVAFAGVASRDYGAETGGQSIEIYEPGSVCKVAIGIDTVVNEGLITCSVGAGDVGLFSREGLPGRGSAVPLQTNANGTSFGEQDGTGEMGAADGILTATFTGGADNALVGDYCYILGGTVKDTGAVDATLVAGKFLITASSATWITITPATTAAGHDNATGVLGTLACSCSYYVMSGQQTALCYLQDGEESGCQEWLEGNDAADVNSMPGGTTYVGAAEGATMGAATDHTIEVQRGILLKRFVVPKDHTQSSRILEGSGVTAFIMAGSAFAALTAGADGNVATLMFDPLGTICQVMATDMVES
jgi:hypothetical protein